MSIINKRSLNLVLVLTLLLSLILPSVSVGAATHQNTGSLTIHKFEREPGATAEGENQTGPSAGVPSDAKPLAGVEYEIIQTHSFDGKDWNEVTDGEVRKVETGDTGIVKVDNLLVGRYTVQEISGPAGVILNDEKFSVDIPMTYNNGKDLAYDVNIYPKNEKIRGEVELTKVNEKGEILSGAEFELFKEDGTKESEELFTTNNYGKIGAQSLAAGKYYFQEKSTVGDYAVNNSKINFTVKKNQDGKEGKTEIVWETIEGFTEVDSDNPNNIIVTNYLKPNIEKNVEGDTTYFDRDQEFKYNISITSPGDIKKYSKIAVTDTLDERLEFITDGSITDGWEVTGTEKGNVTLTQTGQKLEWSVKDITELTPNTDIKITFTAKIKPNAELKEGESGIPNKANVNFNNNRGEESEKDSTIIVTPRDGGIKILKVDKNGGATLAGAEFKLTKDADGETIVNANGTTIKINGESQTGNLENLATNAGGEILITGLTPGTYYLHETKAPMYTADDGTEKPYRLLTKPVEVEVIDNVDNQEVIVENSKSGWLLPTTGGLGTILFTVIGLALMAIALFAYLRRRKTAE